ncbi:MAG: hypothetical protein JWR61_979 [Ferruginibacter sp.]|uniref:DUF1361 domain-containing protein n=1 Tax=Ferruginibacter sp. TaxID=1940288 RepID=UPI00265AD1D4|nr:DUF1361 domain-containing protein [Ferruginibacter sp.]MDB5276024.1 hypothetical protein [Ferruginibacter sp.]
MKQLSASYKVQLAFFAFITVMLVARVCYSGTLMYLFLLWNLFLAWVPFQLSVLLSSKKVRSKTSAYFILAGWLLFFPNALYIITDLIHLEDVDTDVPVWFDAILIFTSSVAGLILAFASLFKVERFLQQKIKQHLVDRLIVGCLFLGSFGVYLGRFLRWNSWDIVTHPLDLLAQITAPFILPLQHYRTWGITGMLTCLFCLLYFTVKKLPGLLEEPGKTSFKL